MRAMPTAIAGFLLCLGAPTPAFAKPDSCNFAPFTLQDGTPMPGMRADKLVFESAAICASLPQTLKGKVSQAAFLNLRIPGGVVDDIVPLGGGLLAPSRRMGCRSSLNYTHILFERGELLLTGSSPTWPVKLAVDTLLDLRPRRAGIASFPAHCHALYRQALLRALYQQRTYTEADLIEIAATTPDTCRGDNFHDALRGIGVRSTLTWASSAFVWARLGECAIWGHVIETDKAVMTLLCPALHGQVIIAVRPADLQAFVGANSGMTANATIHPMNETCLGAWEIWQTRPLEPMTPYWAEDH